MAHPLTVPPPTSARDTPLSDSPSGGASLAARVWAAPLWAHAAALAVVLLALMPLMGTNVSFSADEGAAIVQAQHLADGDGWVVDHPLPQVDPTARAYPLELSFRGDEGTAPFVKHPLYALLLAGADRVGGEVAMVVLSIAGTVTAAALAAAIAGHLRAQLARPSLWAAGLATPLLFDGYLVIAHTLGAAAAAGAVLLALRATDGRGRRWVAIAGAAACIVVAILLRTEAVFWGLGLGVVLGALALSRRSRVVALSAIAVFGAAGAAHFGETLWIDRILGGNTVSLGSSPDTGLGLLAGRVQSIVLTWLRPGYGEFPFAELALVVMLGSVVLGAIAARRHPDDHRVVVGLAAVAAVASVMALVAAPTNLVPGLLVAAPVLAAGLVALRRTSLGSDGARLALGTFALFAMAVAATQYVQGGSGEWGGRYFALGLPVIVPVALLALADAGSRLDKGTRKVAAGSLVVCTVAVSSMGLISLGTTHRFTARLVDSADRAGRTVSPEGKPVMLATTGAVPRLAWATFDRQRWLLSDPDDLGALRGRLVAADVSDVVLVSSHLERDLERLGPGVRVVSTDAPGDRHGWRVAVLRLAP